jgi:hypothetical protein
VKQQPSLKRFRSFMVYPNEGDIQFEISLYCYVEDWPMANLAIFIFTLEGGLWPSLHGFLFLFVFS